ncbi:MAG: hypothetical protein EHM46_03405, partial [Bacteroidetes bacterium]
MPARTADHSVWSGEQGAWTTISRTACLRLVRLVFLASVLASPAGLSSQDTTLNNSSGQWLDHAQWSDGTHPGTIAIASDIHIYGNIVSGTGLDFIAGDLFIHDTLTIFGDLVLGDTLELVIDPGGILIVRGDFTMGDTVDVWTSGQVVVTGEFSLLGDNDQGSFDQDGVFYVFDVSPQLKTGSGYEDFTCGDPVDSCTIYSEADLLAGPLASFYLSGTYYIMVSGPVTFCQGEQVNLSVTDTASGYQWFADGLPIPGETTREYDAGVSGDYHVTFFIGGDSLVTETVTVTVNALPAVSVAGLAAEYCEGGEADTLTGSPAGGFLVAGPWLTILGAGDSATFDPALAGSYDIQYYYTDGNGCTDTATVSATVHPLPAVSFAGLDAEYCENGPQDTLTGSQPGGIFTGTGITDNADGTAIFNPATTGSYDITYYYTDGNGCSDTSGLSTTVHPLPIVNFSGLLAEYCEGEEQDTLTGNQAGGSFTGTGITDHADGTAVFDPTVTGTYDIIYTYTNANGCTDSSIQTVTVHPLPVVNFAGLSPQMCVMDDPDTLTGNQAPGGIFFGGTVADQGNGSGIFTPLVDGIYDIYYAYTDINGCRDSVLQSVTVYPLPVVS